MTVWRWDGFLDYLLEFRVHLAVLHQRPRFDRAVGIGRRQLEKASEQGSYCGGPLRWSGATNRSRFAACCGYEAERLEIAEPTGECILEQTRRQRRCLAPATGPDQCEGLWFRLGRQQDQQSAADLDQVKPAQQDRPASLPHRAHAIGELEGGEQRLDCPAVRVGFDDLDGRQGGVGRQQQARLRPTTAALLQFTPDRLYDDTAEKPGAADKVAQASHPAVIAADAVVRDRQLRPRRRVELGAIQPRAPAPAGCTRRRQLEQGRVAPDLTDNGVTALRRRPDH